MTMTADIARIFADARQVHTEALDRLAQGDVRDAAEKAWRAAKRATDALILARTSEEPERSTDTRIGLERLATPTKGPGLWWVVTTPGKACCTATASLSAYVNLWRR